MRSRVAGTSGRRAYSLESFLAYELQTNLPTALQRRECVHDGARYSVGGERCWSGRRCSLRIVRRPVESSPRLPTAVPRTASWHCSLVCFLASAHACASVDGYAWRGSISVKRGCSTGLSMPGSCDGVKVRCFLPKHDRTVEIILELSRITLQERPMEDFTQA